MKRVEGDLSSIRGSLICAVLMKTSVTCGIIKMNVWCCCPLTSSVIKNQCPLKIRVSASLLEHFYGQLNCSWLITHHASILYIFILTINTLVGTHGSCRPIWQSGLNEFTSDMIASFLSVSTIYERKCDVMKFYFSF